MEELIRQLGQYPGSATATVSMAQTVVAVLLSFVLALITALERGVKKKTLSQ